MTAVADRRDVPVPGAFNVRDVGGYPAAGGRTAWGVLLRSGGLHSVDDEGRCVLADLGLHTVVDLREDAERDHSPSALTGTGLTPLARPIYGGAVSAFAAGRTLPTLSELYHEMLADRGAALTAAVRELARPGALPALVHCAAGKDRTGVVVALTLAAVGVPDGVIAQDYALTADRLPAALFAALPVPEELDAHGRTLLHAIYRESPADVMTTVLQTLRDDHGSAEAFLRHHGMTTEELDTLRTALVVADPTVPTVPAENGA
ncbi:tyrosine-protein phosphatase [Nakamurella leprariae]|uniref:Tyrosine-protein phosphatase n=1 Tax=Nakamurella leprariae TaxID=2803911 RepID=A0A938YAC1_9ACTN|nr:tyrosine-protein phosphatase [Nakamurella leprariae]MBM9468871.1 tyrosine-protein phosphatase [Nakamurella leprariae]